MSQYKSFAIVLFIIILVFSCASNKAQNASVTNDKPILIEVRKSSEQLLQNSQSLTTKTIQNVQKNRNLD